MLKAIARTQVILGRSIYLGIESLDYLPRQDTWEGKIENFATASLLACSEFVNELFESDKALSLPSASKLFETRVSFESAEFSLEPALTKAA